MSIYTTILNEREKSLTVVPKTGHEHLPSAVVRRALRNVDGERTTIEFAMNEHTAAMSGEECDDLMVRIKAARRAIVVSDNNLDLLSAEMPGLR